MKQMMSKRRLRPESVSSPLLVLGAEQDGVVATANAYHTDAEFFPKMGHNMILEPGWDYVAERIANWLETRGI